MGISSVPPPPPIRGLLNVTACLWVGNFMQKEQSFKKLTWEMPEENSEEHSI
jgi:hypothetical protein